MLSEQVKVIEVKLENSEIAILNSARKIIDELVNLMFEIDSDDDRKLLCQCNFEDECFTVIEMEDIGRAISAICDAYRIES